MATLPATLTTIGAQHLLSVQVGKTSPRPFQIHLFANAWTPADSDNLSDYTECSLPGYDPITLVGSDWVVTGDTPQALASYPTILFYLDAYSGPQVDVYGWYLTDDPPTIPIWAQAFANFVSIPSLGTVLPVNLAWNDSGAS